MMIIVHTYFFMRKTTTVIALSLGGHGLEDRDQTNLWLRSVLIKETEKTTVHVFLSIRYTISKKSQEKHTLIIY